MQLDFINKLTCACVILVVSSCTSYNRAIKANDYEDRCDDKVTLQIAPGMSLDRSQSKQISHKSETVDFNSLLELPK